MDYIVHLDFKLLFCVHPSELFLFIDCNNLYCVRRIFRSILKIFSLFLDITADWNSKYHIILKNSLMCFFLNCIQNHTISYTNKIDMLSVPCT